MKTQDECGCAFYRVRVVASSDAKPTMYQYGTGDKDGGTATVMESAWTKSLFPFRILALANNIERRNLQASLRAFRGHYSIDIHHRPEGYTLLAGIVVDFYKVRKSDENDYYELHELVERVERTCELSIESEINRLPLWIRSAAKAANQRARSYRPQKDTNPGGVLS